MRAEFDKDENLWNQFKRHVKSWYTRELEYSTESDMFNRWMKLLEVDSREDAGFSFYGEYVWLKAATNLQSVVNSQEHRNLNFTAAWAQLYSEAALGTEGF